MSLNSIRLQPAMVADFYANSLVETVAPHAVSASAPPTLPFLGGNAKKVSILVKHPGISFLPDEELELLSSVLVACKLSLADVAVINYANTHEQLAIVLQEARHILLFDVDPLSIGLPISFPHFQVQPFDARIYLASPSLTDVGRDKALKMKLWTALKTFFSL
jgi:hypothetical protein